MKEIFKETSRRLRKGQTDAEQALWKLLRNRQLHGHKFRRQHPLPPYILDFYCVEKKLVVELDGGHHLEQEAYDKQRTEFLATHGIMVLRFWNDEIFKQPENVLTKIENALDKPSS